LKNGVVLKKLEALDETLAELRSLGAVTAAQLDEDWLTRRAVERELQILVEIVIDVCQRIISLSGQTPASSGAEAVERCTKMGVLTENEAYENMVRFRNFVVHRYERIDVEILVDIVTNRLQDFELFRDEVLGYEQG
jgi:uncharacterized protein YutE (UPF0331/DUF86 family)